MLRQNRAIFTYNQRKLRTLKMFESGEWIRPEAYAWKLRKLPARAAYSYLMGLWRWGLLVRRERPVRYRISRRGRERLAWLRQSQ